MEKQLLTRCFAIRSRPLSSRLGCAYAWVMPELQEAAAMDWSDCPEVEVVPGKVSGVPILKHSRMPADAVVENYEGGSPVEEIAENFELPEDQIRAVLAYAVKRTPALKL